MRYNKRKWIIHQIHYKIHNKHTHSPSTYTPGIYLHFVPINSFLASTETPPKLLILQLHDIIRTSDDFLNLQKYNDNLYEE